MKTKLEILARIASIYVTISVIEVKNRRGLATTADLGTLLRIKIELDVLRWVLEGSE